MVRNGLSAMASRGKVAVFKGKSENIGKKGF